MTYTRPADRRVAYINKRYNHHKVAAYGVDNLYLDLNGIHFTESIAGRMCANNKQTIYQSGVIHSCSHSESSGDGDAEEVLLMLMYIICVFLKSQILML
jgi:5'-3' exonuclease